MIRYAGIAILVYGCISIANAESTLTGTFNTNGNYQLEWESKVNEPYIIRVSTNLLHGFTESISVQATPPQNIWWETPDHPHRFYKLNRENTFGTNQIVNGDFSNGLSEWTTVVNAPAIATLMESNGVFVADITNGGTGHWHIFIRQFDLVLENGKNYVLEFDAHAEAARTIRVMLQNNSGSPYYFSQDVSIGTSPTSYQLAFQMTSPTDTAVRIHIGLGNSDYSVELDNIVLREGSLRDNALELNRRLAKGNNFMAAKSMGNYGAPEDYALLNTNYFSHCRIGYKMDEVAGSAPTYTIPSAEMDNLQNMVDWCLAEGLIAMIDPVHNWAATGFNNPADLPKLSNIWLQVAAHFEDYDLENVVFEIINEPRNDDVVADIIDAALPAIRIEPGNRKRIVVVCGDGFSTRQALIDALDNDHIPSDDAYLIGTFHYYDPRDFTKQGETGADPPPPVAWGTSAEFSQVGIDFDAVATANTNWAVRNGTVPLPIYLGEFGVDNEADNWHTDRKKWLSWVRMQAEARKFSWAHWNMYQNIDSAKGMGPWTSTQRNDPSTRTFDADPVEALIGRYECEDGTTSGGVSIGNTDAGYTGTGYTAFPSGSTGSNVLVQVNSLYIPKTDTYAIQLHYAGDTARTLQIETRNDSGTVVQSTSQSFPSTGGFNSWQTMEIPLDFEAGELASLRIIALTDEGVNLDWLHITQ